MKKLYNLILITGFLFCNLGAFSQPPPPPPDPSGNGNIPVGGGAPVGSGTLLLIGMAALYGGSKVYTMRSTEESEEE
jgi:hypothetical protein